MDMPLKKKRTVASQAAARGPLPAKPEGLIDQLVKGPMTPTEVQDLMLAFNKALIERATGAEMNRKRSMWHTGPTWPRSLQ
jgi:putative transposase